MVCMLQKEAELSKNSHRTKYKEYLDARRLADERTSEFYQLMKWRNWKFRLLCKRKSSESHLMEKVKDTYGA